MAGEREVGLLWFDDNPRVPLAAKIESAVRRCQERFGRSPDVCYVHPRTLAGAQGLPIHPRVVERASVLPNHFWVVVRS